MNSPARLRLWGLFVVTLCSSVGTQSHGESASTQLQEAQVLSGQGRFLEALEILDAMAETVSEGSPRERIAAANQAGTLRLRRGEYAKADEAFRKIVEAARTLGLRATEARALLNAAEANIRMGQPHQAKELLHAAGELATGVTAQHERAVLLTAIGRRFARLDKLGGDSSRSRHDTTARTYLEEGGALARTIGDRHLEATAMSYQADLAEKTGHAEASLFLARRALFMAQQAGAPDLQFRMQWLLGRIARVRNDSVGARTRYEAALVLLQEYRSALRRANPDEPPEASVAAFYLDYADLLLARLPDGMRTSEAVLTRAIETVELIKATELEDYFQDDCVAAWQAKSTSIREIDEHTAVLYPVVLPDRMEVLVSFRDGIEQVTIGIDKASLTAQLKELRFLLEKRTTRQYLPLAQSVYQMVFEPLEAMLRGHRIDTLVIVPDGVMRLIPMAALHDGEHFLVERYALAVSPGMTLTDPEPFEVRTPRVLVSGLTESVQGFPALPHVARELSGVSALFESKVLQDAEYQLENLQLELEQLPYNVVHLASHARFGRDASDTFLLTFNDRISMNRLESTLSARKFTDEPVELLTLSACQTAAGDERAALGLAGVALKAGARSALASLWYINDAASSQFALEFYRNLQAGQSKAGALRDAQRSLIADSRYRHPAYWAAFILIGNWL